MMTCISPQHVVVEELGLLKACAVRMVSVTASPTIKAMSVTSVHQVSMDIQIALVSFVGLILKRHVTFSYLQCNSFI